MADTSNLDPEIEKKTIIRNATAAWYADSIGNSLTPQARKLLEEYSHIPAEEVESHVYEMRARAWEIFPYPCIGQFRFLALSVSKNSYYPQLLSLLRNSNPSRSPEAPPPTLLDLGCCFAQDLRLLAFAGVPSTQLYGCDLRSEFVDLGYELFRDRDTFQATFLQGDVFAGPEEDAGRQLATLDGKLDVVLVGSFLHLFDLEGQTRAAVRIVKLLRGVGSIVLGSQVGGKVAGLIQRKVPGGATGKERDLFRHDEVSFREMWEEVGKRTGTKWKVEIESIEVDADRAFVSPLHDANMRRLRFAVFWE